MPVGVAFRGGELYVSDVSRILRYDHIEANLATPPRPVIVSAAFPSETHHGWKFIAFGPDGMLYVPVGAPCNICDPIRSATPTSCVCASTKRRGRARSVCARRAPIRSVLASDTKELWFTDNGRDMLGDDLPADELNHASKPGMHFGYPYCHQGDAPDPQYGAQRQCAEFTPPVVKLGAHVAALGMRFYTGSLFPDEYRNNIFIAEHGSWNRSQKIGYRIVRVALSGNQPAKHEVFAEGWLLSVLPSLLVSSALAIALGTIRGAVLSGRGANRIGYRRCGASQSRMLSSVESA
jgi:glucose/arabinose dehydrogenase